MIKIEYIREFLILSETLNFSKAAELAYITQPALSRHIAALEEDLGGKLFERTSRNVILTSAGQAAYEPFQQLLQTYYKVREQTAVLSTGKKSILKISSPYYWTEKYTEPILESFKSKYPNYQLQMLSCQPVYGMQDIIEGRSDILIYMKLENIGEELRCVPYAKERLGIACLKSHPLAAFDSIKLEQIQGSPIITFDFGETVFSIYHTNLLQLLSLRNIYPKDFKIAQQIDTIGICLKETNGICFIPYEMRHMDRSYLKFVPLVDDDCLIDLCLYYRTDNNNPAIPQYIKTAVAIGEKL